MRIPDEILQYYDRRLESRHMLSHCHKKFTTTMIIGHTLQCTVQHYEIFFNEHADMFAV